MNLTLRQMGTYYNRTLHNATSGDFTAAFALNFHTAGERLTAKSAKPKYIALDMHESMQENAHNLYVFINKLKSNGYNSSMLNVAGNGIYSFHHHQMNQDDVNEYLYFVISTVNRNLPFSEILSGGQTGADEAGIVVGLALDIPVIATLPFGNLRRNKDGEDFKSSYDDLYDEYLNKAVRLKEKHSV